MRLRTARPPGGQDSIRAALARLEAVDWDFAKAETGYLTHAIHPYSAKYIPQIPNALIQELSRPGELVVDMFCGSGTTLVEAMLLGRHSIGVDANPLACLISEAKTARLESEQLGKLRDLARRAREVADSIRFRSRSSLFDFRPFTSNAPRPSRDAVNFWFEPFVVEELAELLLWCRSVEPLAARNVALAALSSIVVAVSKQDSETRYVRRAKNLQPGDVLRRFARSLKETVQAVEQFSQLVSPSLSCRVLQADILQKPAIEKANLIVCSPPYPNAYSYHLYHMTRMMWLGMDDLTFKSQEIGSHRKYSRKGVNGATAETFAAEMSTVFEWARQTLRDGGIACFVVGDSQIRGERIANGPLLVRAGRLHGFREIRTFTRRLQDTKKTFNPAIGKIKTEQILILQRAD